MQKKKLKSWLFDKYNVILQPQKELLCPFATNKCLM